MAQEKKTHASKKLANSAKNKAHEKKESSSHQATEAKMMKKMKKNPLAAKLKLKQSKVGKIY